MAGPASARILASACSHVGGILSARGAVRPPQHSRGPTGSAPTSSMMIDPRSATPKVRMSWENVVGLHGDHVELRRGPSGFRATPSRTIMFNTPGRPDSESTRQGVGGGAHRAGCGSPARFAARTPVPRTPQGMPPRADQSPETSRRQHRESTTPAASSMCRTRRISAADHPHGEHHGSSDLEAARLHPKSAAGLIGDLRLRVISIIPANLGQATRRRSHDGKHLPRPEW